MRKFLIFFAAVLVLLIGVWGTLVIYLDEAKLKQIAIEQVRAQTGRTLAINGPLELKFLPNLSLRALDVSLSGPEDFIGPNLFEADEFRMSLKLWPLLRGEIETGDISLDNARLVLHTDASGRSSLDGLAGTGADSAATDDTSTGAPALSTGRIRLTGSTVTMSDAAVDSREVFVVQRLQVDGFAFDKPVPFEFEGAIGEPAMIDDIIVKGTLTVPLAGGAIRVTELGLTAVAAGLPLGLTGRAVLDPGPPLVARFEEGELNLNGKPYRATLNYREVGDRPRVEATLIGDYLNADALLAVMPEAEAPVAEADVDTASPMLLLREFDVDARLELANLVLAGLDLREVRARLSSDAGVVRIDPLSGRLEGGRLDAVAMADLNMSPPLVQFDPVFELESLSQALAPWGFGSFLTGAGILELGVSARGLDLDSILATLDGQGRYALRDGSIQGINFDGLVGALRERDVQQALLSGVGGATAFKTFAGALAIEQGRVRLPQINLVTERIGIRGDVVLTLSGLKLDGELRLDDARLGRVPVALGGSLYKPELTPDVGEALKKEAGRRVLDFLKDRSGSGDGKN
ncbi:MAG: AsmA family protein [Wenzhouxiangellaceae bacterium]|nr:AsmA family protein [Wenzhouxiangellaceae bacterium]